MNISLPPALEKFVHDMVDSGYYSSASEVVRRGLRLLQDQDRFFQTREEGLRRKAKIGIDEIERGEGIVYDSTEAFAEDVKKRGRKRLAKPHATSRKSKKGLNR